MPTGGGAPESRGQHGVAPDALRRGSRTPGPTFASQGLEVAVKVHDAIARAIRDSDVSTIFGLMGIGNMLHITDFVEDHKGRFVNAVAEGGAVAMADGFSRVSGGVGVVTVAQGPAFTNTLTALTEAVRARSSLVVLTGRTPYHRHDPQRFDIGAATLPTGARYHLVLSADHVVDDVLQAIAGAAANRVPTVVDIPVPMQDLPVEYAPAGSWARQPQPMAPADDALDTALGVLASARRPVILAGRGAAISGARAELEALGAVLGAPLATTLLGKGLFDGLPFDIGMIGTVGTSMGLDVFRRADCVCVFGAELNRFTTADGSLMSGKSVVHCDIDPTRLGAHYPANSYLVGDARLVAQAMTDQLVAARHRPSSFRSEPLAQEIVSFRGEADFVDMSTDSTLDVRTVMLRLDALAPKDRLLVTDCGRFMYAPWRYLRVARPEDFIHTANFGSIGLGIPFAVGMAAAQPARTVLGVVGDGGGMMGLLEFSTAVRFDLPVVIVVLNDGCYGAEYNAFRRYGRDPSHSMLEWPEFAEVATAMGGRGVTVRTLADLEVAGAMIHDRSGPLLIDVKVDPTVDIGGLP
jgi:acetolactate synthase I/II/III large subunit